MPSMMLRGALVLVAVACAHNAFACGDKFLAPGRGPTQCTINRPPHQIAVLIYGNPSSPAMSSLTSADYRKQMKMQGYQVTYCSGEQECTNDLKGRKFDVVLADAKDAQAAKEHTNSNVVPVFLNASKDEVKEAKRTYGQAYDASKNSVELLPVVTRAAKPSAAGL